MKVMMCCRCKRVLRGSWALHAFCKRCFAQMRGKPVQP